MNLDEGKSKNSYATTTGGHAFFCPYWSFKERKAIKESGGREIARRKLAPSKRRNRTDTRVGHAYRDDINKNEKKEEDKQ